VVSELRMTNRLLAAIATRGLEARDAVLLLDAVGMSSPQIASVLRMKASTARVLLHRARKAEGGRATKTPSLRDALVAKKSWNKQQLSARVRQISKAVPMTAADAQAIVAHQEGIRIDRFLKGEDLERVQGLIARLNGAEGVAAASRSTPAAPRRGGSQARRGGPAPRPRGLTFPGEIKIENPLLPESKLLEAKAMAEIYPLLYVIENSMRELVQRVMRAKYGADWWSTEMSKGKLRGIKDKAELRQQGETKNSWHQRRGAHNIDYTDFSELRDIILAKQDDFFPDVLGDRAWFEQFMRELVPSRNVVCHMNPLDQHNIDDVVRVKAVRWLRVITERQAHIPSP